MTRRATALTETAAAAIRLKPGKERPVVAGHPWIFSGAVAELDTGIEPGSIVAVENAAGEVIARGYANPRCAITVRVLARAGEAVDAALIDRRIAAALSLRRSILPAETDAFRLLNGEGDYLPGVVADVYGSTVVLQCLTAGADTLKPWIVDSIVRRLRPGWVYERSVGSVRREEGLAQVTSNLHGEPSGDAVGIREHGLRFLVDVQAGQKTGFFLDQRDNRRLARELAAGRRVLNAFAYTGAFAVYAAAGGARRVVSVESSARALETARRHLELNGLAPQVHDLIEADIFELLRRRDETYDLLVLDPPALVKHRSEVQRGARAYKDLHLQALRRAAPGALMLTFSCSQHVPADLFWKIVHGAAVDAGRALQALRRLGPGADHPVSLSHPEGAYLKGLLLRVE
jgi:23S rRNA (cytosine1962-C5)-methyltransferase